MKVRIGKYPSRWVCHIHKNYMESKYGYHYDAWDESITWDEKLLEKLESGLQWLYNNTVNRYYDDAEQSVKVQIDPWDTWSMDYTLSFIVVPMLKQLKETKHGAPFVDMEDRPEHLRCEVPKHDTDEFHFVAWDWAMDEMIYAFESKYGDEVWMKFDPRTQLEEINAEQERISNGFRLFGKYYESLWD